MRLPSHPGQAAADAMIDAALRQMGLNPDADPRPDGVRELHHQSAGVTVRAVEWYPGEIYIAIDSPVANLPDDRRLRLTFLEELMSLNHQATDAARFTLNNNMISLAECGPVEEFTVDRIVNAIRRVLAYSHKIGWWLRSTYNIDMPEAELTEEVWNAVRTLLEECHPIIRPHARPAYIALIDAWAAAGGAFAAGAHSVALRGHTTRRNLAALVPSASAGPIVHAPWGGLEKGWRLRPEDAQAVRNALPRPPGHKITDHALHLRADNSLTPEVIADLVKALKRLDKALTRALPATPEVVPDLAERWNLQLDAGNATIRNIHNVLEACPAPAQTAFVAMIQAWYDAGNPVYTNAPNRITLRLQVGKHTFGLAVLRAPNQRRGANIDLVYPLDMYFDDHPEARAAYEEAVARLPNLQQHNSGARIMLDPPLSPTDLARISSVLLDLAAATRPK